MTSQRTSKTCSLNGSAAKPLKLSFTSHALHRKKRLTCTAGQGQQVQPSLHGCAPRLHAAPARGIDQDAIWLAGQNRMHICAHPSLLCLDKAVLVFTAQMNCSGTAASPRVPPSVARSPWPSTRLNSRRSSTNSTRHRLASRRSPSGCNFTDGRHPGWSTFGTESLPKRRLRSASRCSTSRTISSRTAERR